MARRAPLARSATRLPAPATGPRASSRWLAIPIDRADPAERSNPSRDFEPCADGWRRGCHGGERRQATVPQRASRATHGWTSQGTRARCLHCQQQQTRAQRDSLARSERVWGPTQAPQLDRGRADGANPRGPRRRRCESSEHARRKSWRERLAFADHAAEIAGAGEAVEASRRRAAEMSRMACSPSASRRRYAVMIEMAYGRPGASTTALTQRTPSSSPGLSRIVTPRAGPRGTATSW